MTAMLLTLVLAVQQPTSAPDAATQAGSAQATYNAIKGYILRSAEKMPVEHFAFQPTPDVRSFGQILAHIADANYLLCAPAVGQTNPNGDDIQKTEHAKLDRGAMIEKLKESFAYCDRAFAGLTEANAGDIVTFGTRQRPRLAVLWFHVSHAFEHYGNLVTYLRLKGIVPPTSESR